MYNPVYKKYNPLNLMRIGNSTEGTRRYRWNQTKSALVLHQKVHDLAQIIKKVMIFGLTAHVVHPV